MQILIEFRTIIRHPQGSHDAKTIKIALVCIKNGQRLHCISPLKVKYCINIYHILYTITLDLTIQKEIYIWKSWDRMYFFIILRQQFLILINRQDNSFIWFYYQGKYLCISRTNFVLSLLVTLVQWKLTRMVYQLTY